MRPLVIDLFCGRGGWSKGFLAEGYQAIGFDIERHAVYPGELVLQDVATLDGKQFRGATVIVASPPCQAYSYRAMPWKRAKALPPPSNELFDACFRIARDAGCPLVVENVKGAQPWVGRAKAHFGSYYLWGNIASVGGAIVPENARFGCARLRPENALKVPGFNFHQFEKTGKPGGSFQSAPVKGMSGLRGFSHPNGKGESDLGGPNDPRRFNSKSPGRKAASAAIAEIPYDLANWIARCFKP